MNREDESWHHRFHNTLVWQLNMNGIARHEAFWNRDMYHSLLVMMQFGQLSHI
jgi:hypothetical protein